MYVDDLETFTRTLRAVARSMRAKLTDEEVLSYFSALKDQPLGRVVDRLRDWQCNARRRWFPTAAQLRSDDPDAPIAEHGEPFSNEWWTEVKQVEQKIAKQQTRRMGAAVRVDDAEISALEREVSAAARGLSLHDGLPEANAWYRRYDRACLMHDRAVLLRRVASLEQLPEPENETVRAARAEWLRFLRAHAERLHDQLVKFYTDDDPFAEVSHASEPRK